MDKVLLITHLGCGDALVCNGMIRELCKRHRHVVTAVKSMYLQTLQAMFADVQNLGLYPVTDSAIEVPVGKFKDLGYSIIAIGDNGPDPRWRRTADWTACLYQEAAVPSERMRAAFYAPRDAHREEELFHKLAPRDTPYIFLHHDPSRGFTIDERCLPPGLQVVQPGILTDSDCASRCLLDYCLLIQRATWFVTIDSSFAWLHELMGLNKCSQMHTYAKSGAHECRAVFHGKWQFVD